jgi:hypothetical protein
MKLIDVQVYEQYLVKISNKYVALETLDDNGDINKVLGKALQGI